MRDKNKQATLGELLGSGKNKVTMDNLPEVLGLKMPELPKNRVGKLRLIHAFQQRFGVNYRQMPGVSDVLGEFEQNISDAETISKNKES
jgi:hypothetical protein